MPAAHPGKTPSHLTLGAASSFVEFSLTNQPREQSMSVHLCRSTMKFYCPLNTESWSINWEKKKSVKSCICFVIREASSCLLLSSQILVAMAKAGFKMWRGSMFVTSADPKGLLFPYKVQDSLQSPWEAPAGTFPQKFFIIKWSFVETKRIDLDKLGSVGNGTKWGWKKAFNKLLVVLGHSSCLLSF